MIKRVSAIYPTYTVEYCHLDDYSHNSDRKPPVRNYTPDMSKESRKQLMNGINWMKLFNPWHQTFDKVTGRFVNFRLNFITLTLCADQMHTDEHIKKHLLEPMLKWLIRQGVTMYVWKAEVQNNGNIHFHITTNFFIHYLSLRRKWNNLLRHHGYIDIYMKKWHNDDPNSTDIHAVKDDMNIAIDMVKYFGKEDLWCHDKTAPHQKGMTSHPSRLITEYAKQNRPLPIPKRKVSGRKYSMSNNLTNIKCFISDSEPDYMQKTSDFLKQQKFKKLDCDYATIWKYDHLIESKAPEWLIEKLKSLKEQTKKEPTHKQRKP